MVRSRRGIVYVDHDPLVIAHGQTLLAADAPRGVATGAVPYVLREPARLAELYAGLELLEPGQVSCPRWRPETTAGEPDEVDVYGAVDRKP